MHILIAEDDAHLCQGLADLLSLEGHECIMTSEGAAALEAFRTRRPDFCLLDVMMPAVDGIELCRTIRNEDESVPILLLSARGQEIDRVLGLESGADDYLSKPFATRELVARIKAIARRSQRPTTDSGREPPRFRMDDLEIDAKALRAFRGDQMIDLSRRELALLSLLYAHQGQALSRDALLDRGWGRRYLPSSRALDQYISVLRHKIERDPAHPRLILTVHGVGYRYDG